MRAAVFGASGGIGSALVAALAAREEVSALHALSRRPAGSAGKVMAHAFDLDDEASIAAAAAAMGPLDLVLVATGALVLPGGRQPEKSWRALDPQALAEAFRINAIGPALIARHVLPLLPREGRSVFAALSARVGSISDNRLGGWHGYRMAKAALNMLVRNLSIELARTHREAICVALHPGTVGTPLSEQFLRAVPPTKVLAPPLAAEHLLRVIAGLGTGDSGGFFAWDGSPIPF